MKRSNIFRHAALVLFSCFLVPAVSWGHGIAGKRFFPTTLAIDDPFMSDELSFLVSYFEDPGGADSPSTEVTAISGEFSKRITQRFGISVGDEFRHLNPSRGKDVDGFANIDVGAKYQFLTDEPHETILSVGVNAEIGKTGKKAVGADSFSTISPRFFFGKGLGDLPESLNYLRPFAITGLIGPDLPTGTSNPDTLSWGLAVEYNLQYLQSFVRDVGLGAPFDRMVAVVEFPVQVCLDRGCSGATTGTVNPGVVWFGKSVQLGLEAQIPINDRTGHHVGGLALVHFFLDDLFPRSIGRPVFDF